jgi:hypothetical protein
MNADQPNAFVNECTKCGHKLIRHFVPNRFKKNPRIPTGENEVGKCNFPDCNCKQYEGSLAFQ